MSRSGRQCAATDIATAAAEKRIRSAALSKRALSAANAVGARPLLARLDLELDPLASVQAVEVERLVQTRTVEEVLDPVFGGNEAEAAV